MNGLADHLAKVSDDLTSLGFPFALVGGLAVSALSEPRFTRDLDLAVAVQGDGEAESLVRSMMQLGYRTFATIEQDDAQRLATVRLVAPGQPARGVVVDLLFASSGIEAEITALAAPLELFPGLVVPVARAGHLVAMKLLAHDPQSRPMDHVDARMLASSASLDERSLAEKSLQEIFARGFGRGRSPDALMAELRSLPWRSVSHG